MTDSKVVSLLPVSGTPERNHLEVIHQLEQALAHAANVRCRSVAIILDCDDGSIMDSWHNGGKPYEMLGAIESLKIDFVNAAIERRPHGN